MKCDACGYQYPRPGDIDYDIGPVAGTITAQAHARWHARWRLWVDVYGNRRGAVI